MTEAPYSLNQKALDFLYEELPPHLEKRFVILQQYSDNRKWTQATTKRFSLFYP
jgi:hypothetical protein